MWNFGDSHHLIITILFTLTQIFVLNMHRMSWVYTCIFVYSCCCSIFVYFLLFYSILDVINSLYYIFYMCSTLWNPVLFKDKQISMRPWLYCLQSLWVLPFSVLVHRCNMRVKEEVFCQSVLERLRETQCDCGAVYRRALSIPGQPTCGKTYNVWNTTHFLHAK